VVEVAEVAVEAIEEGSTIRAAFEVAEDADAVAEEALALADTEADVVAALDEAVADSEVEVVAALDEAVVLLFEQMPIAEATSEVTKNWATISAWSENSRLWAHERLPGSPRHSQRAVRPGRKG
jgi:hypothetical protein